MRTKAPRDTAHGQGGPTTPQSDTRRPTRIRYAEAGDAGWVQQTFQECLGLPFPKAIASLRQGTLEHGSHFFQALMVIEDRETREPIGAALAGPSTRFMSALPPDLAAVAAAIAAKLSGIAVTAEHRGNGYGHRLLTRTLAEYRQREYHWIYGQFAESEALSRFYQSLGFDVHPAGAPMVGPATLGSPKFAPAAPDEQWFDLVL